MKSTRVVTCSRWMISRALRLAFTGMALVVPAVVTALPVQSWNGYRWGRVGAIQIALGNNYSENWKPFIATAIGEWNSATDVGYASAAGQAAASACNMVYGTVQVCSGNYGQTGWVGYTNVSTSSGYIVQAMIRLNDYYFTQPRYNTYAWRAETVCQELGNALGLQDSDHNFGNVNTGSCMDYSRDPSGTAGTNGTLANIQPSSSDLTNLNAIYAVPGGRQVAASELGSPNAAIPEPSNWAMLITGFGLVGAAARCRRSGARPA